MIPHCKMTENHIPVFYIPISQEMLMRDKEIFD